MFERAIALLTIGLAMSGDVGAQQASVSPQIVRIRKHTALKFTLVQPLDSAAAKVGDDVPIRLVRPLVVNGVSLLPAGELAHGRVTKVKRAKKCQDGQIEWELNHISFADSTTAKSKVLFVTPKRDFPVEDSYSRNPGAGDQDLNTKDALGLGLMTVVALPYLLISMLLERDSGGCAFGTEYFIPTNSTVVVAVTKDHRVRH